MPITNTRIGILNFASAKNPGGGFLGGSQAQEESLARSIALYASLQSEFQFYEEHREMVILLYSHSMIFSPNCPVFRDDQGVLLSKPMLASLLVALRRTQVLQQTIDPMNCH